MNLKTTVGSYRRQPGERRPKVFPLLLLPLLTLPAAVQAQFNYVIDDDTGTIIITGYYDPGGAVIIPDTIDGLPVTGIGTFAFRGHTSLTSVTIPDSVTSIGDHAFAGCASLISVTIPASITSIGTSVTPHY